MSADRPSPPGAAPSEQPLYVLSLWQPWATLHVVPDPIYTPTRAPKENETRHFRPRLPLPFTAVIHATKKWDGENKPLIKTWPFDECLRRIGYGDRELPLGALIGTVEYHHVWTSEGWLSHARQFEDGAAEKYAEEYGLGNYEPGRFAWASRNPQPFKEPIPFKGRQDVLYPLSAEYVSLVLAHAAAPSPERPV